MNFRQLCAWIAILGVSALPVLAQSAPAAHPPAGPVQVPPGYATNAPATAPAAPALNLASPPAPASDDDDSGDIHDIRGVIPVPYAWRWVFYVIGALALAVALYYLWKWLRRTVIKPKLPHEIALERLEAARGLMTENQVREYAFAVSEVIRNYIEQRFGERAARRTTEEFLNDLLKQTGTPLAQHRALLEDFLSHCDLPKFARWQLSVREMESMHESARVFIFNTRPNAVAPAPANPSPELVPAK